VRPSEVSTTGARPWRAALPLLAAAALAPGAALAEVPLGSSAFGGFPPSAPPAAGAVDSPTPRFDSVETFDSLARAQLLARELPRRWTGTYQSFGSLTSVPVELRLFAPQALGQMVDLRGQMRIGELISAVQGNLNARTDQLDLLLLSPVDLAGIEPGGLFTGVQGLTLSGWQASRLTNPGGRLELSPASTTAPEVAPGDPAGPQLIRGLW
jgi:hypothetical protein